MKVQKEEKFYLQEKKLNKHEKEQKMYYIITNYLLQCGDYNSLRESSFFKMCGFERLKHELNMYYSFNLSKSGGTFRLIVKIDIEANYVRYVFISTQHYNDFKRWLGR